MWVFSPPATQDCLLLQQTLRGSFLTHAATVLGEDSAELRILSRAVECVLREKAEPALAALLQALLLLNLGGIGVDRERAVGDEQLSHDQQALWVCGVTMKRSADRTLVLRRPRALCVRELR